MSNTLSSINWKRVILGGVVGTIVTIAALLAAQVGYGVVIGFQLRGAPPQEMLMEAFATIPFRLVFVVLNGLGGFVGGRVAARRTDAAHQLNGLAGGIATVLLMLVVAMFLGGITVNVWLVVNSLTAVLGGWLGGLLVAGRTAVATDGIAA